MKYFVCVLSNKTRTRRKVVITENTHELMYAENNVNRAVYKKCSGLDELIYTEECSDLSTAEKRRDELRTCSLPVFSRLYDKIKPYDNFSTQ